MCLNNINKGIFFFELLCLFKDCQTVSLIPATHYVVLSTVTSLLRKVLKLVWFGQASCADWETLATSQDTHRLSQHWDQNCLRFIQSFVKERPFSKYSDAIALGSIKIDFNTCLYPGETTEHVTTPAARALLSKTLDSVWFGKSWVF